MKEYAKNKLRKGMFLSILAVLIVFIAMPVSLAVVDSWNNTISNEYETYIEYNNLTRARDGYIRGTPNIYNGATYLHYNSTDAAAYSEVTFYDKSIFSDGYSRLVLSPKDTSDSTKYKDELWLALNITPEDLIKSGATRAKIHIDAGKPVRCGIYYQADSYTYKRVVSGIELNSTSNYSKEVDIDIVYLLEVENSIGKTGNILLGIFSYNETAELSPGDIIFFDWQFLKKKGNVATIYTVDNLMFGWGAALILIGFASTPFFNPMSRDVFPLITKMKRSRAAKQAAAKRKRTKRRSSKRSSSRKRRRR